MSDTKPFTYYTFTFLLSHVPSADAQLTFSVKHNGEEDLNHRFSKMAYVFQLPAKPGSTGITEISFPASQLHSIRKYVDYSNTAQDKDFSILRRTT